MSRPLDQREIELIEKMLERDFPGRDELRSQVSGLVATKILDDGTLVLKCDSNAAPSATRGLVAQYIYQDADGQDIDILLHVGRDGFIRMLEILKCGPDPIVRPPIASDLTRGDGWPRYSVLDAEAWND